jgi:hypothetical protein
VTKSRSLRCAGHAACKEEMRIAYKILAGKTVGKRPLGNLTNI